MITLLHLPKNNFFLLRVKQIIQFIVIKISYQLLLTLTKEKIFQEDGGDHWEGSTNLNKIHFNQSIFLNRVGYVICLFKKNLYDVLKSFIIVLLLTDDGLERDSCNW